MGQTHRIVIQLAVAPLVVAAGGSQRLVSRAASAQASKSADEVPTFHRKTLEVVGQFGEQGKEAGNFQNAHHIMTDSRGNLYTAEVSPGSRAQKFVYRGTAVKTAR